MSNEPTTTMQHKILIVEDEPAMAKLLSDKVAAAGFVVRTAGDGEAGLAEALAWQPDLILLDIVMPKMDGMTMLHKLREQAVGKKIPVILLTNLSSTDKVYDAVANGVHDFLVKADWDIDDVVKEIQGTLGLAPK